MSGALPEDVDAWADALLDQHREAPAGARFGQPASQDQLDRLTPMARWMLTKGGNAPDADRVEQLLRSTKREQNFARVEAIFTIVGVVGGLAFLYVVLSGF